MTSIMTLPTRVAEETTVPLKAMISDAPRSTIKHDKLFLLMDAAGMMPRDNNTGLGLYADDTRFLCAWRMTVDDTAPVLIHADTTSGYAARYRYANREHKWLGEQITEQRYHIERRLVIAGAVYEKLTVTNFDVVARTLRISLEFDSDFADMFEIRGWVRKARGHRQDTRVNRQGKSVRLGYIGLDWMERSTTLTFDRAPDYLDNRRADFDLSLPAGASQTIEIKLAIEPVVLDAAHSKAHDSFNAAFAFAEGQYAAWRATGARITTDDAEFNRLVERTWRDLYMLRQHTPRGTCVAAGIPWFAVAFGRDQEITGLSTLDFAPATTRDILQVLTGYMGTKLDEVSEERPGRILHELRQGEMANLKEHAFTPYYGTVDATPLYLVLMTRYVEQSDDLDFASANWPKVEAALSYLESRVAEDPRGYLVYGGKADAALANQGWKDSNDSVMVASGKLAAAPIALCEVQGYLYHAWVSAAKLARRLGKPTMASSLEKRARALRKRFQRDFWMPDRDYPALALHAGGRQCDVVSSNAGHLLITGILTRKQARAVSKRLMQDDMYSGYGIRTLSSSERAYNPLSYHNGSIWPHDNGIAGWGMALHGDSEAAATLADAIYRVALTQPDLRLPELYCGFARVSGDNQARFDDPVRYPISCSPQAWSAASLLALLSGCLQIQKLCAGRKARVALPAGLNEVTISGATYQGKSHILHYKRKKSRIATTVIAL